MRYESAIAPEDVVSTDLRQAIDRDFRRNAIAGMLFEATWALGMSFAIAPVLVPTYLTELAAPRWLIGLASALVVLTIPLQLFAERMVGGRKRLRNVWLLCTGSALAYLVLGTTCALLPESARWGRIGVFVVLMAIFFVLVNFSGPIYMAVLTDNCPVYRRGRLFSYRSAALGLTGVAGLWPARWVLSHYSGPAAYHASILCAGTIYIFSSMCPLLIRDHIDPTRLDSTPGDRRPGALLGEAVSMLRQYWLIPNYRVFMFFAVVLVAAASLSPFIVTYGRDVVSPNRMPALWFQISFFAAILANGVVVGLVADRWGYQLTLVLLAGIGLGAFGLVQYSPLPSITLIAYGLAICMSNGMTTVIANLSVELLPQVAPARLVAAANVYGLPLGVLLPWLSGMILDGSRTAGAPLWGYHVAFTVAIVLTLFGGLGTLLLVQEPRTGRIYEIKVLPRQ